VRDREQSIGRWISILYRIGQLYIGSELEQYQIGKGQHAFLCALYQRNGIRQGELASMLSMDKGTVTHALIKLEQAGYIVRQRDQRDRRINLVYLTDKAKNIEELLFDVLASWTETLADGLTEEERSQTLTMLRRMAENATTVLAQR